MFILSNDGETQLPHQRIKTTTMKKTNESLTYTRVMNIERQVNSWIQEYLRLAIWTLATSTFCETNEAAIGKSKD